MLGTCLDYRVLRQGNPAPLQPGSSGSPSPGHDPRSRFRAAPVASCADGELRPPSSPPFRTQVGMEVIAELQSRFLPSGSRCGRSSGRSLTVNATEQNVSISPDGGVDDLHHALVDALTHVDQRSSSFSHPTQEQTCNSNRTFTGTPDL